MRHFSLLLATAISLSVAAQTDPFAFNFFEAMQGFNDQNVLVSPLSIKQAVGMAANGAQNQTLTEILSLSGDESLGALNLRNEEERTQALDKLGNTYGTILKVANSAWHSPLTPFSDAFRDSIQMHYTDEIRMVDFGSQAGVDSVNAWVNRNTCGLIPSVMNEPDPFLTVKLLNAIYFKGSWEKIMSSEQKPFRNADGQGTTVDMMKYSELSTYLHYQNDFVGFHKHFTGFCSLFVVMPRDPNNIPMLTAEAWNELLNSKEHVHLNVSLPKFQIDCKENILPVLQDLGAFIHNEFDGMGNVTAINHLTRLSVDENGAEAAAVTDVTYETGFPDIDPLPIVDIAVDRPFYVFIVDSRLPDPLFMGRVNFIEGEACEAPAANIFSDLDNLFLPKAEKKMINGHVVIRKNGMDYNLLGQQM